MPDDLAIPPLPPLENGYRTRRIIGLVAALLLGALAYSLLRSSSKPSTPPAAIETRPQGILGPEESAYLSSVGVDHLEVSRAENFLHQEVTTIAGEITNGGARPLASVELTLQFSDLANQITQREVRTLFGPPGPPIPPGDHREFEVSFEHISAMWNMRPPVVKVTALQFSSGK